MEKDIGQKDDTESLALTEYKKNNFFKRLLDFFNKNKLKKFDYTEHKDTAVFPFGQVLIEYDGKKIDYHKVQKNKSITDLSNEELSYIKKLRKIDSRYIYNAEDIRRIVAHNPNIDEHGDYVEILSLVEKIIPKGCDRNFYRNIKDLKIQLDMEDTLENTKRDKTLVAGAYDIKENEIIIPKEFIELIFNGSTSNKDFSTKIKLVLLHELFHMASSEYDKEKDIVNCGFYVYPTRNMEQQNVGLTEGMTEMCVSLITGVSNSNNSTYSVGELFCKQLCLLVGLDTMLESYFNNLGIENIKKKLTEICGNMHDASTLLTRIDFDYYLREIDSEQTILAAAQRQLINYFKERTKDIHLKGLSEKAIKSYVLEYENSLVTPQVIENLKKNPKHYLGISESIDEFKKVKENIFRNIGKEEPTQENQSWQLENWGIDKQKLQEQSVQLAQKENEEEKEKKTEQSTSRI